MDRYKKYITSARANSNIIFLNMSAGLIHYEGNATA
jgi:hypothetical protein